MIELEGKYEHGSDDWKDAVDKLHNDCKLEGCCHKIFGSMSNDKKQMVIEKGVFNQSNMRMKWDVSKCFYVGSQSKMAVRNHLIQYHGCDKICKDFPLVRNMNPQKKKAANKKARRK